MGKRRKEDTENIKMKIQRIVRRCQAKKIKEITKPHK